MSRADTNAKGDLSRDSLQRLTSFLLVVAAGLLAAVIALAFYILWDRQEVASLKGSLLAQQQLQEELLANQDSDHAPYPHLDPGLSFVLNPALQQATWKTGEHLPYHINHIGLRGKQINPKPPGVKRIALVGDSVLFGWKIGDRELLAGMLQQMADQRLGPGNYEFVTVALPGWNTIDQESFLRNHLGRLDPDYIVWSLIRNDLLDSGGVVPPGMLMTWNAPHKSDQQAFQFLPPGLFWDAPAPVILSRWASNLERIQAFSEEHQIPTSLLWWRATHRPLIDHMMDETKSTLPVLHVPGRYRYDEKQWCVAFPDCHPTPWANRHLAVGVMDELTKRGAIGPVTWTADEQAIVEAFAEEAGQSSSPGEQRAFLQEQAALVPERYATDGTNPVLFGLRDGKMARNGIMLLRRPGGASALVLEIASGLERPGPAQVVEIRVRSSAGDAATGTFTLSARGLKVRLDLAGDADFGLYELEWRFKYAECERPSACYSARLLAAHLSAQ